MEEALRNTWDVLEDVAVHHDTHRSKKPPTKNSKKPAPEPAPNEPATESTEDSSPELLVGGKTVMVRHDTSNQSTTGTQDSIETVRAGIMQKESIPADQQRLVFQGMHTPSYEEWAGADEKAAESVGPAPVTIAVKAEDTLGATDFMRALPRAIQSMILSPERMVWAVVMTGPRNGVAARMFVPGAAASNEIRIMPDMVTLARRLPKAAAHLEESFMQFMRETPADPTATMTNLDFSVAPGPDPTDGWQWEDGVGPVTSLLRPVRFDGNTVRKAPFKPHCIAIIPASVVDKTPDASGPVTVRLGDEWHRMDDDTLVRSTDASVEQHIVATLYADKLDRQARLEAEYASATPKSREVIQASAIATARLAYVFAHQAFVQDSGIDELTGALMRTELGQVSFQEDLHATIQLLADAADYPALQSILPVTEMLADPLHFGWMIVSPVREPGMSYPQLDPPTLVDVTRWVSVAIEVLTHNRLRQVGSDFAAGGIQDAAYKANRVLPDELPVFPQKQTAPDTSSRTDTPQSRAAEAAEYRQFVDPLYEYPWQSPTWNDADAWFENGSAPFPADWDSTGAEFENEVYYDAQSRFISGKAATSQGSPFSQQQGSPTTAYQASRLFSRQQESPFSQQQGSPFSRQQGSPLTQSQHPPAQVSTTSAWAPPPPSDAGKERMRALLEEQIRSQMEEHNKNPYAENNEETDEETEEETDEETDEESEEDSGPTPATEEQKALWPAHWKDPTYGEYTRRIEITMIVAGAVSVINTALRRNGSQHYITSDMERDIMADFMETRVMERMGSNSGFKAGLWAGMWNQYAGASRVSRGEWDNQYSMMWNTEQTAELHELRDITHSRCTAEIEACADSMLAALRRTLEARPNKTTAETRNLQQLKQQNSDYRQNLRNDYIQNLTEQAERASGDYYRPVRPVEWTSWTTFNASADAARRDWIVVARSIALDHIMSLLVKGAKNELVQNPDISAAINTEFKDATLRDNEWGTSFDKLTRRKAHPSNINRSLTIVSDLLWFNLRIHPSHVRNQIQWASSIFELLGSLWHLGWEVLATSAKIIKKRTLMVDTKLGEKFDRTKRASKAAIARGYAAFRTLTASLVTGAVCDSMVTGMERAGLDPHIFGVDLSQSWLSPIYYAKHMMMLTIDKFYIDNGSHTAATSKMMWLVRIIYNSSTNSELYRRFTHLAEANAGYIRSVAHLITAAGTNAVTDATSVTVEGTLTEDETKSVENKKVQQLQAAGEFVSSVWTATAHLYNVFRVTPASTDRTVSDDDTEPASDTAWTMVKGVGSGLSAMWGRWTAPAVPEPENVHAVTDTVAVTLSMKVCLGTTDEKGGVSWMSVEESQAVMREIIAKAGESPISHNNPELQDLVRAKHAAKNKTNYKLRVEEANHHFISTARLTPEQEQIPLQMAAAQSLLETCLAGADANGKSMINPICQSEIAVIAMNAAMTGETIKGAVPMTMLLPPKDGAEIYKVPDGREDYFASAYSKKSAPASTPSLYELGVMMMASPVRLQSKATDVPMSTRPEIKYNPTLGSNKQQAVYAMNAMDHVIDTCKHQFGLVEADMPSTKKLVHDHCLQIYDQAVTAAVSTSEETGYVAKTLDPTKLLSEASAQIKNTVTVARANDRYGAYTFGYATRPADYLEQQAAKDAPKTPPDQTPMQKKDTDRAVRQEEERAFVTEAAASAFGPGSTTNSIIATQAFASVIARDSDITRTMIQMESKIRKASATSFMALLGDVAVGLDSNKQLALNAMCAALDTSQIKEAVFDTANNFKPRDQQDIRKRMERLQADKEGRDYMGEWRTYAIDKMGGKVAVGCMLVGGLGVAGAGLWMGAAGAGMFAASALTSAGWSVLNAVYHEAISKVIVSIERWKNTIDYKDQQAMREMGNAMILTGVQTAHESLQTACCDFIYFDPKSCWSTKKGFLWHHTIRDMAWLGYFRSLRIAVTAAIYGEAPMHHMLAAVDEDLQNGPDRKNAGHKAVGCLNVLKYAWEHVSRRQALFAAGRQLCLSNMCKTFILAGGMGVLLATTGAAAVTALASGVASMAAYAWMFHNGTNLVSTVTATLRGPEKEGLAKETRSTFEAVTNGVGMLALTIGCSSLGVTTILAQVLMPAMAGIMFATQDLVTTIHELDVHDKYRVEAQQLRTEFVLMKWDARANELPAFSRITQTTLRTALDAKIESTDFIDDLVSLGIRLGAFMVRTEHTDLKFYELMKHEWLNQILNVEYLETRYKHVARMLPVFIHILQTSFALTQGVAHIRQTRLWPRITQNYVRSARTRLALGLTTVAVAGAGAILLWPVICAPAAAFSGATVWVGTLSTSIFTAASSAVGSVAGAFGSVLGAFGGAANATVVNATVVNATGAAAGSAATTGIITAAWNAVAAALWAPVTAVSTAIGVGATVVNTVSAIGTYVFGPWAPMMQVITQTTTFGGTAFVVGGAFSSSINMIGATFGPDSTATRLYPSITWMPPTGTGVGQPVTTVMTLQAFIAQVLDWNTRILVYPNPKTRPDHTYHNMRELCTGPSKIHTFPLDNYTGPDGWPDGTPLPRVNTLAQYLPPVFFYNTFNTDVWGNKANQIQYMGEEGAKAEVPSASTVSQHARTCTRNAHRLFGAMRSVAQSMGSSGRAATTIDARLGQMERVRNSIIMAVKLTPEQLQILPMV